MAQQTKFEIEDAEQLLIKLESFRSALQQERQKVDSAWGNLNVCWFDQQFHEFQPVYEHLSNIHRNNATTFERYVVFLQGQIRVAERRAEKLSALGRTN